MHLIVVAQLMNPYSQYSLLNTKYELSGKLAEQFHGLKILYLPARFVYYTVLQNVKLHCQYYIACVHLPSVSISFLLFSYCSSLLQLITMIMHNLHVPVVLQWAVILFGLVECRTRFLSSMSYLNILTIKGKHRKRESERDLEDDRETRHLSCL